MRNIIPSLFCAAIVFASCKTAKPVQYLSNGYLDTAKLSKISIPEPIIQKGDILTIVVYSDNPEATSIYNQMVSNAANQSANQGAAASGSTVSASATGAVPTMPGYFVDYNGNIQMHALGNIKAVGLSREELAEVIKQKLIPYLNNPYATVKIQNYRVTVLGEVAHPGVINYSGDHLTVLQALGMAGDFSTYGLKDSIILVREYNGKREFANIDVTKPDLFLSPYYYMQQNDMLIVKANPKKPTVSVEQNTRRLSMATAIMTLITSMAVLVTLFK